MQLLMPINVGQERRVVHIIALRAIMCNEHDNRFFAMHSKFVYLAVNSPGYRRIGKSAFSSENHVRIVYVWAPSANPTEPISFVSGART